jgi:hypothetical protein
MTLHGNHPLLRDPINTKRNGCQAEYRTSAGGGGWACSRPAQGLLEGPVMGRRESCIRAVIDITANLAYVITSYEIHSYSLVASLEPGPHLCRPDSAPLGPTRSCRTPKRPGLPGGSMPSGGFPEPFRPPGKSGPALLFRRGKQGLSVRISPCQELGTQVPRR